jgi:hypothetical protein
VSMLIFKKLNFAHRGKLATSSLSRSLAPWRIGSPSPERRTFRPALAWPMTVRLVLKSDPALASGLFEQLEENLSRCSNFQF